MDYKGFQRFVLIAGTALVIVSATLVALVMPKTAEGLKEVVGQLLFFLLLIGAVYDGWRGGVVTAILASTIYAAIQFPTILSLKIEPVLPLILVRAAIYLVTGPLGGGIMSNVKKLMIEASHNEFVDTETKIFNKLYFAKLASVELARFERYNTVSSIVMINLEPRALAMYLETPKSPGMMEVAKTIVNHVRLVDEVGRLSNDIFGVILPFTANDGAQIVASRLAAVTSDLIGYEDCVEYEVISLPNDKGKMEAIIHNLAP